ncbi:MAG: queuosine precursor transporter [Gammaproteobacteria bacterium]|nr:queuosine precursor transporter [Gammaproteobacteria bacterium]
MADQFAHATEAIQERRERVFLVLAGFFICAMTLLNVIGITRFVQLGPMQIAVGVLAYPLTFLCTDVISELYGRARANFLVTVGLLLNGFILLLMYVANAMPAVDPVAQPPWQVIELANSISLPDGSVVTQSVELFSLVYACTAGAVLASMLAYVAAQYIDVYLFHFLRQKTGGKHLWLRNNGSTVISQAVDSIAVISITFGAVVLSGDMSLNVMFGLMLSNYVFKFMAAIVDTPLIYLLVHKLRPYLELDTRKAQPATQSL